MPDCTDYISEVQSLTLSASTGPPTININPHALSACGLSIERISQDLCRIYTHLGEDFITFYSTGGTILDPSSLQLLHQKAEILYTLRKQSDFEKVIKTIRANSKGNLNIPVGEWFQLQIAYLLHPSDPSLQLETKAYNSNPQDIVINGGAVNIECKSFLQGDKITRIFENHLRAFESFKRTNPKGSFAIEFLSPGDGFGSDPIANYILHANDPSSTTLSVEEGELRGFRAGPNQPRLQMLNLTATQTIQVQCFMDGPEGTTRPESWISSKELAITLSGPPLDQCSRFLATLDEKYHQMTEHQCNIFALDLGAFTGSIEKLAVDLRGLLSSGHYPLVAGVILVNQRVIDEDQSYFAISIVQNPDSSQSLPDAVLRLNEARFQIGLSSKVFLKPQAS